MPVCEGDKFRLVADLCFDADDHRVCHGNQVPIPSDCFLALIQFHERISALDIPTGTKVDFPLGYESLDIAWDLLLMHLTVLSQMQTEALF